MLKFELVLRCVARLIASREARLGRRVPECVVASGGLGVGEWVLKFVLVLWCVAWLTASREAPLGRRISERIVVFRVWGWGASCENMRVSQGAPRAICIPKIQYG